jgi:AcrR family transcriptional regulator
VEPMTIEDDGVTQQPRARRPGRPPQTDEEAQRAREHILQATLDVFGVHGYHGVSVARIIEQAQIARPTFYRYFRNTDEAVETVLVRVGYTIATVIGEAVIAQTGGHIPQLVAGIEAYLGWARENPMIVRSMYAGGHDPTSPVFNLRPRLVRRLTKLVNYQLAVQGRAPLDEWTIDLFVNSMEYACFRLYDGMSSESAADEDALGNPHEISEAAVDEARRAVLRTALSLLGTAEDWQMVLATPPIRRQLFDGRIDGRS